MQYQASRMLAEVPVAQRRPDAAAMSAAAPAAAPLRLLLLVGSGLQPDSVLRDVIAREGMRGLWLADLHQAAQALRSARVDAIVVERAVLLQPGSPALPPLTGYPPCPVIAVGPRTTEVDELLALSCGATAFVPWPLTPERLLAQLQALFRIVVARESHGDKAARPVSSIPVAADGWQVDRVRNQLWRTHQCVSLTNAQSALLHTLLTSADRLVSRGQLAAVLPGGHELSERAVDVYLSRLRRRLQQAGVTDLRIKAVSGRGYHIVCDRPAPVREAFGERRAT